MVRNSVALLSLAAYCRWWDHKARKWYFCRIQGEEEAVGHDWSEILLLCSHWLNVAGGGISKPHDWSEILLLLPHWLNVGGGIITRGGNTTPLPALATWAR